MLVKDKAAQDAADVLEGYWANDFPVDPERIALAMGMTVERLPLQDGVSGMLRVEPHAAPEVFIDSAEVPQRQRFTIAHEIGHYYERTQSGERDFNFIDQRGAGYDVHEFYADEFAGNLLMPAWKVQEMHGEGAGLAVMASAFGVSLPAMRQRLKRLGLAN